jgi:hypothetical protein
VLHDGLGDPVDAGVPADDLVVGVHQNDLIVLVCGVLDTNKIDIRKSTKTKLITVQARTPRVTN